jgi:hypothetical protein
MHCFHNSTSIDWVAFSAVLVAVFSLGVAVFALINGNQFNRKTLLMTETHNKKTVEPLLTHFYLRNDQTKSHSLKIQNSGFGPAKIISAVYTIDGKQYKKFDNLVSENMLNTTFRYDLYAATIENSVIASNQEVVLFKLDFLPKSDIPSYTIFHELSNKTRLDIKFETIYGESREFSIDALCGC